jgi:hypothetical protein
MHAPFQTFLVTSTGTLQAPTLLARLLHMFPGSHLLIACCLQVRLRLIRLPLHLVLEVKVRLVKVVHTHVTILTTGTVRGALGVHSDVVQRTEVATYATDFLSEDLVVEARFEFTLAGRGCCDVHGGLSSTEDDVVFYGGDGGAVEGCVGDVGLEDVEGLDVDELCGLVLGGGDEVCSVGRPLQVGDCFR